MKSKIMAADYVIVGAGSAGCVLASRLSEDENCSVILIEAGGTDQRLIVKEKKNFDTHRSRYTDFCFSPV